MLPVTDRELSPSDVDQKQKHGSSRNHGQDWNPHVGGTRLFLKQEAEDTDHSKHEHNQPVLKTPIKSLLGTKKMTTTNKRATSVSARHQKTLAILVSARH